MKTKEFLSKKTKVIGMPRIKKAKKPQKEKAIAGFRQFCKALSAKDRVALLHHSDPDGFCAAAIFLHAVKKKIGKMPVVIENYEYADDKKAARFLKKAAKKKANKLVIVDISIDGDRNHEKIMKPFEQVLVIDHHKLYKDLSDEKTVFIKAHFVSKREPSAYPASKLCFDLFSKCVDIEKADWIACVGIIGDKGYAHWKSFFKKTMQRTGLTLTELHRLTYLAGATEVMAREKMPQLLKLFLEKKPGAILKTPFRKCLERFEKALEKGIASCGKNCSRFPELELLLYETSTATEGLKSYVINELSEMHPKKTVVLIQDSGHGYVRASARRQDCKVKMNELMERAIKGIPDSNGGGHIPAAAAKVPKKYREKFRKNLFKALKAMKK